jgi:hypothetical protein
MHDRLRVFLNLKTTDPELDRDSKTVDECFVLGDIVGGGEV